MKDFGPSCFHSASTGGGNANAAPEGGVQAFDNACEFGCGGGIWTLAKQDPRLPLGCCSPAQAASYSITRSMTEKSCADGMQNRQRPPLASAQTPPILRLSASAS